MAPQVNMGRSPNKTGDDIYEGSVCASLRMCVCVILPAQKAPQSRGPPGTRGPRLARTAAGHLPPAGGRR